MLHLRDWRLAITILAESGWFISPRETNINAQHPLHNQMCPREGLCSPQDALNRGEEGASSLPWPPYRARDGLRRAQGLAAGGQQLLTEMVTTLNQPGKLSRLAGGGVASSHNSGSQWLKKKKKKINLF